MYQAEAVEVVLQPLLTAVLVVVQVLQLQEVLLEQQTLAVQELEKQQLLQEQVEAAEAVALKQHHLARVAQEPMVL
jgi:hypothetical protein